MKKEINQIVFKSLMQNLGIQPAKTKVEKFDEWMRNKVKSIHYSNNEKMTNAYNRILQ